jgi:trimeric autotransporter adhesin
MNSFAKTRIPRTALLSVFLFLLVPFCSFAQPNDICSNATTITGGATCANLTGQTVKGGDATAGLPAAFAPCGTNNSGSADVWYSYTAHSPFPTIAISNIGSDLRASGGGNGGGVMVIIYSETSPCTGLVAVACNSNVNSTTLNLTPGGTGLIPGNNYRIRVSTNNNSTTTSGGTTATWGFSICVTDVVNDLCSNAIALTPASACAGTTGTLTGSSYTTIPTIGCGVASRNDVWYSFVAQTTNPTIAVSAAPTNTRIQLFSGSCGALVPVPGAACGTASITAASLVIGDTYFVRVYADPNATGTFSICVTDPPPANDLCGNATSLTSSGSCVAVAGTLAGSSYTATTLTGCANGTTNKNDVWYTFQAKTTNPTITVSNTITNPRLQLFSGGTCGAPTGAVCSNTTSLAATGLTIGATYRIRVYSNTNDPDPFTICVADPPPANDECTGAVTLTPALTTCGSPVVGNVYASSASAVAVAPCAGPVAYDVWYSFTAVNENATVTLSALGSQFLNQHLQLFSGDCSFLSSIACGIGSVTASGLTPGNKYFIRVYSTGGALPSVLANSNFTICVTYAPAPAPANDLCTNAITLNVNSTCAKTMGTLESATVSSPAVALTGTCTGVAGIDVWYKFVATAATTNVTLADFGANFGTTRRIQIFSGSCGALTIFTCLQGTGTSVVYNGTTFVAGTTYYIRVVSSSATAPTSAGDFSICLANPLPATRSGNGYINVTRQTAGGVVQNGDILEIRTTVNLTSGTIYKLRYVDNVPTNTSMQTGAGDRIRILTNEGIQLQAHSLAADGDAATYKATPPAGEYQIRMNIGLGATNTPSPAVSAPVDNTSTEFTSATGQATAGNRPAVFGSTLFATAFQVKVTGVVGDTITIGAGKFIYRNSAGGPDIELTSTQYKILITSPLSLCADATGINMSQEFGGTFGTGTTLNRGTDLAFPIPGYAFTNISSLQALGDGQYAIVKNMSPRSGIDRDADRTPTAVAVLPSQAASDNRMHGGHWDIDGDHTGTVDAIGNAPTDNGVSGGYMLLVNADYVASETYRQTLTNLCPNTYYEFSAWFRNICPTCGSDYTTGNNYTPKQPGVKPNLTFSLDGLDRYNTGEIPYNYLPGGPTNYVSGGWVKKGFVFVTGPTQNTATFSIRNNSQGGGGNDWAMDDIKISTCLPDMEYTPTVSPLVCEGSTFKLTDTIRSFFSNYVNYIWQRSTTGPSGPWTDVTTPATAVTGPPVAGVYKYWTNYNIPSTETTVAHDGDIYRLIVATTTGNLGDALCQVTDGVTQITIDVITCGPVLKTDLVSFNAKLVSNHGNLSWTTTKEEEAVSFKIEKSLDGINFTTIGTVSGYDNNGVLNNYSFVDPEEINGKVYYRIAIVANSQSKKYSRTVELHTGASTNFKLNTVINPFSSAVEFEVTAPSDGMIDAQISDIFGKMVKKATFRVSSGVNALKITDASTLAAGTYILVIKHDDQIITKKILKSNL